MAAKKYTFDAYWGNLPDELTPVNVGNLLQLSETNINKKLNNGEIPGYKIGDCWRITREELKADIDSRKNDEARRAYLLAELERVELRLKNKVCRIAQ